MAKAPKFSLKDQNGKTHTLGDYSGKWLVLYFCPADLAKGCVAEARAFRDEHNDFQALGVTILGVSEGLVAANEQFVKEHELPFTMLSDPDGEVLNAYRATGLKDTDLLRRTCIIDPNGEIVKEYARLDPKKHAKQVVQDLTALQLPPKSDLVPNEGKKLDLTVGEQTFCRYPLKTKMVSAEDDLQPYILERVEQFFETLKKAPKEHSDLLMRPWQLFVSEKIVAITQGRSYFIWDIKPGVWARLLSRFVVRTPYGIGLGSPWTMQLAIQEAGLPRIMFAAAGGILGKMVGKKGWFYILAGSDVRAIDGPTEYSVYPSNVSAKLPPEDPQKVAVELSELLKKRLHPELTANFRGVVVIDANDLGRNVLGHDTVDGEEQLEAIFADNPLGQGSECTPLCVVFER
ncbi:MAG: redoxin domain-containing protein [Candidatus Saccharimonadales bacterium]